MNKIINPNTGKPYTTGDQLPPDVEEALKAAREQQADAAGKLVSMKNKDNLIPIAGYYWRIGDVFGNAVNLLFVGPTGKTKKSRKQTHPRKRRKATR